MSQPRWFDFRIRTFPCWKPQDRGCLRLPTEEALDWASHADSSLELEHFLAENHRIEVAYRSQPKKLWIEPAMLIRPSNWNCQCQGWSIPTWVSLADYAGYITGLILKNSKRPCFCVFLKSENITKKRAQQHERMFLLADYAGCICFKIILCNDSISVS